jgi:hypothetical protein
MKPPSKLPDVSLKTPLASGMALDLTSVPDLLLLLQQQADLLANQHKKQLRKEHLNATDQIHSILQKTNA